MPYISVCNTNLPKRLSASPVLFSERVKQTILFFTTNEAKKITDSISCHSKNLIYLTDKNAKGATFNTSETKRQLSERFGEHRRSILNHQQPSAQLHQYHYTLTKLAILLTTSASSRLNSYHVFLFKFLL